MRALWVSDPTKMVAREVVLAHLKNNTDLTILDMYNSWLDRDFIKYTSIYYPYIAFITDKHYSTLKNTPKAGIFQLLEYHFLSLHTNCVYIDTVVENIMRLFCFIVVDVGLENYTQPSNSNITTFLDNSFRSLLDQYSPNIIENLEKSKENIIDTLKKCPNSDVRDLLNTIALTSILSFALPDDIAITNFYVKVFLIHLAIIKKFDLQSRNIYLPGEINMKSDATLSKLSEIHSKFSNALLLTLQITNTNEFKLDSKAPLGHFTKLNPIFTDSEEKESEMSLGTNLKMITDIFDARLITYISIYLLQTLKDTKSVESTALGFDEDRTDYLNNTWQLILENSHLPSTEFFPITSPCTISFQFDLKSLPDLNIQSVDVANSNTRLVKRLAGNIKEAMQRDNEGKNLIKFVQPSLDLAHFEQDPSILFPYLGSLESRLEEFDEQNKVISRDKRLRGLQQYHKYMNYYSSSLTGGLGWKEPIIVERIHDKVLAKRERDKHKEAKAKEISAKQHKPKGQAHGASKKSGSKKEEIMKLNMEKKIHEIESKYGQEWVKLKESLKSTLVSESHVKRLDAFTLTCTSRIYRLEAQLLKLQYLVLIYHEDKGKVSNVSNILQLANSIINQHFKGNEEVIEFPEKGKKKIIAALLELGFNLNANFVADEIDFDITSIIKDDTDMNNDEGIEGLTCIEFQLKYMGHLMPRAVGTERDERVTNFIPDAWQVDLLNVVDRDESAVIHAPTSSGKTFISYYIMLKILRANDEDLVVYVSPSKELMNQVSASIYAQFGHKTFKNLSMTLYGFFSDKYEMKPFASQVLVTLPEPFEYILLSCDPECKKLRERIKYVIFDEVHCISAENKSECWERLLLLIKSPFLALSATIRNAKSFTQWLLTVQKRKFESIQKERSKLPSAARVQLISHEQRFSDLSKFRFDDQTNSLHHVHPWTCLKYEHLRTSGYPNDLTLISDECLGAYEALRWITRETETIGEDILDSISRLDPNNYFSNLREISKNDVREFDKELSALLLELVRRDFNREYEKLMEHLRSKFNQEEKFSILPHSIKVDKTVMPLENEKKLKESNDLRFLRDLESSYKLPCIIFITDLYDVNRLALSILDELEHLEQVKWSLEGADKKVSKEKQIRELNKELDRLRKRLDTKLDEVAREEVESQVQGLLDELSAVPDEDEVDENYTFAYQGILTSMEIDKLFQNLKGKGQTPLFKRLMARGIMIHHEELRAKERQMAEISYRLGYVRILISTSTLALGIHMPCKTVVFYKDSLFLTALQYRQMSGRAGRRGYDLVGNVIFHNIHTQKFNLLNTAPVGRLYGNHIWSTSTLLRLVILLQQEETKENINAALTLFHKPFLTLQNPNGHISDIIKYEVLFSDHYLMQEGYLFENGDPTPISALVSFFSFAEPYNFILVTLLRSGLLNEISLGYTTKDIEDRHKENIKKKLILILCHIFNVRYIPPMKLNSSNILPDLPDEIQKLYDEHNFRAFRLYQSHLHFMCSQLVSTKSLKDPERLPISDLTFTTDASLTTHSGDSLLNMLRKSQLSSDLISPFLQNSGLTENHIRSTLSLAKCLPPSIEIDTSILPISPFWSLNSPGIPKNNYIYRMATDAEITIEELLETSGLTDPDLFKNLSEFGVAIGAVYFLAKFLLPLGNEFRAALDHANDLVKKQIKKLYRGVRV